MASDVQLTRLHDRLDQIGQDLTKQISSLSERVAAMTVNCPIHERRLGDVEVILHGPPENGGHPGLIDRVRETAEAHRRLLRAVKWLAYGLGALTLTLVGAIAEPLLKKAFGL